MNPHVFIVGCPRSGTTLLERIVNAHPELAIVHESRWIARIYEQRRGLSADGRVTPKLAERLIQPRSAMPFGLVADDMAALVAEFEGAPFASLVSALFDRFAAAQGKPLAGDKSPGYVRYLPLLAELWPEAKFVHIIRDGRDVFLSVREWGKGATRFSGYEREPAATTARWWEWYVLLGREGGSALGSHRYHELTYESLVRTPERVTSQLCEFMGIRYDERMLGFHEGRERDNPRLDAKKAWRPVTAGLRSWREQMDPADVVTFEAVAGELLSELGYPLSGAARRRLSPQLAGTCRAFDDEVRTSARPLPVAWSGLRQ